MNQLRGIHKDYFIWWPLLNALICYSNALKVWMQSDMPLCQWSSSRKGTVISPFQVKELLAYYQHRKFAPLCRINDRSHSIEFFSDLWSLLDVFDNISKTKNISYRCHFVETSIFAPKSEVCEIDGLFRFQNGLNKLSRIWSNSLKSKMAHKMIFTCYLWQFSKSVVSFLKMCFFKNA